MTRSRGCYKATARVELLFCGLSCRKDAYCCGARGVVRSSWAGLSPGLSLQLSGVTFEDCRRRCSMRLQGRRGSNCHARMPLELGAWRAVRREQSGWSG